MKHFIYGLFDPRTGHLRYVGKAVNMKERLATHIREARTGSVLHSRRWIHGLLLANLRPEIDVLEECDNNTAANDAERYWISYLRFVGADLTNRTPGGDGQTKGYRPTPEAVRKSAKGLLGKKRTPEQRERLRKAFNKPELRERRRQIVAELVANNPEWLAAVRRGRTGKKNSQETKRKMAAAWTPERKAAHAKAKSALPLDERWRGQLAAALKARWDKKRKQCSPPA